jgi:5-methyltetrahydropteroyltriglutamate--homocysteine methyltransferase
MPRRPPPFHAEHVGSFLRPPELAEAARQVRDGRLDAAAFGKIQDQAVRDIVAFQEGLGLQSISDGEFRRRGWSAGFIDAVAGFGLRAGTLGFRDLRGDIGVVSSPYAKERIRRVKPIVVDEFRFLKSATVRTPKVTIPSPPVMHYFLGPKSFERAAYPDVEAYFADLAAIYRAEIADLAAAGCTYLQLDDTALACHCDVYARADVKLRGENPEKLIERYARLINEAIGGRPPTMTVAMHLCRGNLKGAWMAEGGYEPVADVMFNRIEVDAYFLEYDSPRAGDFAPLRHVPADKAVVLGLVSTKTPALESQDELKRRIDEASRHVALDRLGLSPQCGFSSAPGSGQVITPDDQRRKLELVVETAREVWGSV